MTLVIRKEAESDFQAVHNLQCAAFEGPAEADLVNALRDNGDAVISLVALSGEGQVLGHILLSRLDAPMRALALAPVAVLPEHQKTGIGGGLIREALSLAELENWQSVFVLGDPSYYERFGFSGAAAIQYDCVYAGQYFMARHFDKQGPGAGQIIYPTPFQNLV
ncbi:MAG: N-acetyltransferase [Pseudomonadota bacterium]|nr:N-acetyltransferase [Pseudomonadota bacterium]QKK05108.1 MAG: N-acetyltransferase [Pseudomonadota bacterium]